ncbi:MAG: hypothetical protein HY900_32050 [Deltaproteobacteria bacterium]|nr:hypothetical protein [Deltaproteobacteria bacterium]
MDPVDLASQLSRWTAAGKIVSLRRGVYAFGEPYRRRQPHPFEIANLLVRPSYVSLESALWFRGMLPEAVFAVTSVTTARPAGYETQLGTFDFRHLAPGMFWGYTTERLAPANGALAFVARSEKALLDLVYLRSGADAPAFLRGLRLARLEVLDPGVLTQMAERLGRPRLARAAEQIARLVEDAAAQWEEL